MEIRFTLEDLLCEAEDDCPNCGGVGVKECSVCHGKAKVLNEPGRWLVRFIESEHLTVTTNLHHLAVRFCDSNEGEPR